MRTVAALYIDPIRGPYPHLPGVECWGLPERDALGYVGTHPVVAHPPCGHWGKFATRCRQPIEEKACGPAAIEQVRRWGGVLEHPQGSALFRSLPIPRGLPDEHGGWTMLIDQARWGHAAQKLTLLYFVGIEREDIPPIPPSVDPPAGRRCSTGRYATAFEWLPKTQRHLTPPAFAAWLVEAARRCERPTP